MTTHYQDATIHLHHGDCVDVLRDLADASIDSVVTDPPYGLEFMGKDWDGPAGFSGLGHNGGAGNIPLPTFGRGGNAMKTFQTWCETWATECFRVLKPGGHILAFGGTRTWHRLACAIEDAGFEIRDGIAWLYASGFPKSLDISKGIDKAAGAEREVVGHYEVPDASKVIPAFAGPTYGDTGYASREYDVTLPATEDAAKWQGWGTALKPAFEPIVVGRKPLEGTTVANVLKHGTGAINVDASRLEMSDEDREKYARGAEAWKEMCERRGQTLPDGSTRKAADIYGDYGVEAHPAHDLGRWPPNVVLDEATARDLDKAVPDVGGASRYFLVPKADQSERVRVDGVLHPTVKPLTLMRWLIRLVTPPGGTVLEPFAGSGTTVEACILEGFNCVAIEREATYLPLIVQRVNRRRNPVAAVKAAALDNDATLFDLLDDE